MSLRSPIENKNADSVMPAWIAGIQARKDASGNIHVNLIPALHAGMTQLSGPCFKMSETPLATFSKECFISLRFVPYVVKSAEEMRFRQVPNRLRRIT
jgi:hypothetical protein